MADTLELLIVPHTHWDREWYQTFQQFRMRLVRAVDRVLDVLEHDPGFAYFMLDGQTIPLDDYLEVRPENEERLRVLIRSGKLLVGPWYLQPDEFLVDGESLIRNLQVGMRMAEAFGSTMRVGYVPDIFGHVGQLPQILRGFSIDNAVFWRGVGPEVECSEFQWAAPDGTQVLGVWLCDVGTDPDQFSDGFRGYSNARSLPLQPDALLARLATIEPPLRRRATAHTLLLMNGTDHAEPEAGLPAAIAAANKRLKSEHKRLVIGTLPQYVQAIKQANPSLATYTGEMRSSRWAHLLPGVLSTRMWIKQRNAACEALLLSWAEPFSAWAWLLGAPHPSGLLRVSWRHLLHNHPHDSICGTSIDQVHREMGPRFDQSEQVAQALTEEALAALATQVDTQSAAAAGQPGIPIVVFNPGPGPRTGLVCCDLEMEGEQLEVVDDAGAPVPVEVRRQWRKEILNQEIAKDLVTSLLPSLEADQSRVEGFAVRDVRFSMESGGTVEHVDVIVSEQGTGNPGMLASAVEHLRASARRDEITSLRLVIREVPRADIALLATNVPARGARTYFARARPAPAPALATPAARTAPVGSLTLGGDDPPAMELVAEPGAIENEYYRVELHAATGTLTVHDKITGARFAGLNLFQDGGDVGDLYNYCPPRDDVMVCNPRYRPHVELLRAGPAQATLRIEMVYELPAHCSADRQARHFEVVECPISSEVSLSPGVRRVDIRTEVENLARDHRLRVLFPAPLATETAEAESTFEVVRRPVRQPQPLAGEVPWSQWAETPVDQHPQKRFVDVSDGRIGLAVLNRGLPEYEVTPWPLNRGVAVALTLLRCVEWLSRDDLSTRRGHAGPMEHTPDAQCPGRHTFEYALVPHAGTWHADELLPLIEAQAFEAPMRARVTDWHGGKLPASWSFVEVSPDAVVVSAVRRAEREDALIIRIYNPTDRPARAEVKLLFAFRAVRLANLNEEELPETDTLAHSLEPIEDQGVRLDLRGGEIATLLFRF
jgi:mannosylglycerate hydrolase